MNKKIKIKQSSIAIAIVCINLQSMMPLLGWMIDDSSMPPLPLLESGVDGSSMPRLRSSLLGPRAPGYAGVHGWMVGWMDGWMDGGWMGGWLDG